MKKLLLLCALFVAAPVVFAQDYYGLQEYGLRKNTTRVELYGGMVLPQDSWSHNGQEVDLGTTGWTAGIGFTRNIISFFSLGLDANYAQLGDGDTFTSRGMDSYYRTGIATGLVTGRVTFFPSQATRLYIPFGAGVGHMFARQKFDDGSHLTTSSTDLAQMVGLGLEFDIDDSTIFGVEGRYYLVEADSDFKDAFGKSRIHYMNVMLKLGWRF
ncbi:outer membrane protein [Candidatus Avelusimicrobium stercoris]|uniref:outer membrane protein n=1 Tax=Candidatus Avelusimicrobium stercoris TaxID=1947924 RepID=UPI003D0C604F